MPWIVVPDVELEGEEVVEDVEVVAVPTLMGTLVMQEAPLLPQALTCRVCAPEEDDTFVLIEVACTIVVLPESME